MTGHLLGSRIDLNRITSYNVCYTKLLREWAKTRVQGGKTIIGHDGIRAQLAEMRMLIDASRSYIHRAAWLADHREQGWDATLGTRNNFV